MITPQEYQMIAAQMGRPAGMMMQPFSVTAGGASFHPTISDARRFDRNQMAQRNMVNRIMAEDPTAARISDTIERIVGTMLPEDAERGSAQWQHTHRMARDMASMALRTGAGDFLGGNRMDMIAGASASAGRAFLADGSRIAPGSTGNIALTETLVSSMRNQFMTPEGGINRGRTHGFDIGQMGQIMQLGAARGGFGEALSNLEMEVDAAGRVQFDDSSIERLTRDANEFIESAAGALASVRDLFGDRGMDELFAIMEQVSGMPVTSTDRAREATRRMGTLRGAARAAGLDERAFVEQAALMGGIGRQLDGGAITGGMTVRGAVGAAHAGQYGEQRHRSDDILNRNEHVSMEDRQLEFQNAMASMGRMEDLGIGAVLVSLAERGELDGMTEQQAIDLVSSGATRDDIIRAASRHGVGDIVQRSQTMDIASVVRGLSAEGQAGFEAGLGANMDQRLGTFSEEFMRSSTAIGSDHRQAIASMNMLSQQGFSDLDNLLAGGDVEGALQLVEEFRGFLGEDRTAQLQQTIATGDLDELRNDMRSFEIARSNANENTRRMLNNLTSADIEAGMDAAIEAQFGDSSLRVDQTGLLEGFIGGAFFGEDNAVDPIAALEAHTQIAGLLGRDVETHFTRSDLSDENVRRGLESRLNLREHFMEHYGQYDSAMTGDYYDRRMAEDPEEFMKEIMGDMGLEIGESQVIFDRAKLITDLETQKNVNERFGLNLTEEQMGNMTEAQWLHAIREQDPGVVASGGLFLHSGDANIVTDRLGQRTVEGSIAQGMLKPFLGEDELADVLAADEDEVWRRLLGVNIQTDSAGRRFLAGDDGKRMEAGDVGGSLESSVESLKQLNKIFEVDEEGNFVIGDDDEDFASHVQMRQSLLGASGDARRSAFNQMLGRYELQHQVLSEKIERDEVGDGDALIAQRKALEEEIKKLASIMGVSMEGFGDTGDQRMELHIGDDSWVSIARNVANLLSANMGNRQISLSVND